MDALVRHLRDTRTSCVIDVGANCGQYGLFLRSLGYRGKIISFEPVRESFDELLDRTRFDPGWKAFPIALGEVAGEMPINIVPRSDFNSLKEPNDLALREYDGVEPIRTESVQVERLDRVLQDLIAPPPEIHYCSKRTRRDSISKYYAGRGTSLESSADYRPKLRSRPSTMTFLDLLKR